MKSENLNVYARLGMRVYPVESTPTESDTHAHKRPPKLVDGRPWCYGFASTDPTKLAEWCRARPDVGFVAVTGETADVIDCDGVEACKLFGRKTLAELGRHGLVGDVMTAQTAEAVAAALASAGCRVVLSGSGGGLHFYCRPMRLGSPTKVEIDGQRTAIDVRGGKVDDQGNPTPAGLIVCAGSPHFEGRFYRWVGEPPQSVDDLPDAPKWFVTALQNRVASAPKLASVERSTVEATFVGGSPTDRQNARAAGWLSRVDDRLARLAGLTDGRKDAINTVGLMVGRVAAYVGDGVVEQYHQRAIAAGRAAGEPLHWCETKWNEGFRDGVAQTLTFDENDPLPPQQGPNQPPSYPTPPTPETRLIGADSANDWRPLNTPSTSIPPQPANQAAKRGLVGLLAELKPRIKPDPVEATNRLEKAMALIGVDDVAFDSNDSTAIAARIARGWLANDGDVVVVRLADGQSRWFVRSLSTGLWRGDVDEVERVVESICRYRLTTRKGEPITTANITSIVDSLRRQARVVGRFYDYLPKPYDFVDSVLPPGPQNETWFALPNGKLWGMLSKQTIDSPPNYWAQRVELACIPKPGPTPVYEQAYSSVGIFGENLRRLDQMIGLAIFGKGRQLSRAPLFVGPGGVGKTILKRLVATATGGLLGCTNEDASPKAAVDSRFSKTQQFEFRICFVDDKTDELKRGENDFLSTACGEVGPKNVEEKFGALSQREIEQVWFVLSNTIPPVANSGGRAARRWLTLRANPLAGPKDARLFDKLVEEIPALLWRWCLAIQNIWGPDDFPKIAQDSEMIEEIQEEGSLVARWLSSRYTIDPDDVESTLYLADGFDDFQRWCFFMKRTPPTKRRSVEYEIGREIAARLGRDPSAKNQKDAKGVYFRGVRRLPDAPALTVDGKIQTSSWPN